eukprot:1924511-Ditylum_brightwellii.AAC.1
MEIPTSNVNHTVISSSATTAETSFTNASEHWTNTYSNVHLLDLATKTNDSALGIDISITSNPKAKES